MSTAFRNFFLTFITAAAVFGLVAWKFLPDLEKNVIEPALTEESRTESVSPEESVPPESSKPTEESKPEQPIEDKGVSCLFIGKTEEGRVCSLIWSKFNEEKGVYVTTEIPPDLYLQINSGYVPFNVIAKDNNTAEIVALVASLVGEKPDYFFCITPKIAGEITDVTGSAEITLPYEVKYLSPEFSSIPDELLSDEHYVKLGPGKVECNGENIYYILKSLPEGETEFSYNDIYRKIVYRTLFDKLFSKSEIGNNPPTVIELIEILNKAGGRGVVTNASADDILKYAKAAFSKGSYTYTDVPYPTYPRTYNDEPVKTPNVSEAINKIRAAYNVGEEK